jgi:integrase/recombinase XerC
VPDDLAQIDAYTAHLRLAGHPPTTIRTYRTPLTRAASALPHGLLSDADDIAEWLAGHTARNTRATYAVALRGLYRWAVATGRLAEDPMAGLPVPRQRRGLPRPVSHAELAGVLAAAGEPVRTWCLLAAYAGLRCVEISRLDRADVTEQVVYVHGKGDRDRAVPTHPEVWRAVAALPPGPVAGCAARYVSSRIARTCDRIGLGQVTAHRLRHWAGTWWQAASGDLRVTQELLGHASPATTAVYTAVSDRSRRAAVLALPPVTAASGAGGQGQGAGRP